MANQRHGCLCVCAEWVTRCQQIFQLAEQLNWAGPDILNPAYGSAVMVVACVHRVLLGCAHAIACMCCLCCCHNRFKMEFDEVEDVYVCVVWSEFFQQVWPKVCTHTCTTHHGKPWLLSHHHLCLGRQAGGNIPESQGH